MDGLGIPFERRRWGLGNTVIRLCISHAVTVASLLYAGKILCKDKPQNHAFPAKKQVPDFQSDGSITISISNIVDTNCLAGEHDQRAAAVLSAPGAGGRNDSGWCIAVGFAARLAAITRNRS